MADVTSESEAFPEPYFRRATVRRLNVVQLDSTIQRKMAIENEGGKTYEIGRQLKKAIFGQVIHALELRTIGNDQFVRTGKEFAIKVYSKKVLRQFQGRTQEDPYREISALQFIGDNHAHLMGQIDSCTDEENIYSIMRFFPGGELFDYLTEIGRMDEDQARDMFKQLLDGLNQLTEMGIGHRDMSLENILYDNCSLYIIIDFGMCVRLKARTHGMNAGTPKSSCFHPITKLPICGKKNYCSPEVLRGDEYFNPLLSDIWAAGIILFMLLTGVPPVETATFSDERYQIISRGDLKGLLRSWRMTHMSDSVIDLIQNLLRPNPADRLTLEQIAVHPWMVNRHDTV